MHTTIHTSLRILSLWQPYMGSPVASENILSQAEKSFERRSGRIGGRTLNEYILCYCVVAAWNGRSRIQTENNSGLHAITLAGGDDKQFGDTSSQSSIGVECCDDWVYDCGVG